MMYAAYREQVDAERDKRYKQQQSDNALIHSVKHTMDKKIKDSIQRRTGGKK